MKLRDMSVWCGQACELPTKHPTYYTKKEISDPGPRILKKCTCIFAASLICPNPNMSS